MLKLMIADDERAVRETIASLIDWESLGVKLIGCCRDGIEAYNMILDESPDLVMTDIRMPGLSGIELIARIVQAELPVRFIILSGYEEFEYAREAMKYGVKHYLLKPCNEEQIRKSVLEVREECLRFQEQRDESRRWNSVEEVCARAEELIAARTGADTAKGRVADSVIAYVELHLSDQNLTLKRIAEEELFMNVDYVSRQFLKETGKKFSQYLTERRVNRAKELLMHEETSKIQYVAMQVGCGNNAKYFSQIFKKTVGQTPSAWAGRMGGR